MDNSIRWAKPLIFFCSLQIFIYEIVIGRIFSVLFSYDILFIIISLSVLGLGLGGIYLRWLIGRERWRVDQNGGLLIMLSAAFLVSLITVSRLFHMLGIVACTIISMAPFFIGGIILSGLYHANPQRGGSMYFLDLTGGAVGCLLSLPVVQFLGIMDSIMFTSVMAAAMGLALGVRRTALGYGMLILAAGLLCVNQSGGWFNIGPAQLKHTRTPLGTLLGYPKVRSVWLGATWDVYSRCDLVELPNQADRRRIFINGGSEAVMLRQAGDVDKGRYDHEMALTPYLFGRNDRVLVIGSGGGKDVRLALTAGAGQVTAVEINPAVVNMVAEQRDFNGDIYNQPNVSLAVEDGRTFIHKDEQKYDRIVLNLAYSYAFADVSSISQMENYLYTQEGFEQYFEHLDADGALVIFIDYPELLIKFLFTCLEHFKRQGVDYPQAMSRVMVVSKNYWSGTYYALLVAKNPYRAEVLKQAEAVFAAREVRQMFVPGQAGQSMLHNLASGRFVPAQYIAKSSYHLSPATDDNPFFLEVVLNYRHRLAWLAAALAVLSAVILAVYLKFFTQHRVVSGGGAAYFFLIGTGFMLLEIALTKRFSFFLGYPQLNLGVILAFLLLSCGLGAYLSERFKHSLSGAWVCWGISALLLGLRLSLGAFIGHTVAYALPVRIALLLAYLLPAGLLMGMPFPLGLRQIRRHGLTDDIPWFWGINGIATVTGSVACVVVAMAWGFNTVFYAAAGCYLAAGLVSYRLA